MVGKLEKITENENIEIFSLTDHDLLQYFFHPVFWWIVDDRLHRTAAVATPARHHMDMQMVDFLPARAALVYADRDTIRRERAR